jgi:hypothetical protein
MKTGSPTDRIPTIGGPQPHTAMEATGYRA